MEGSINFGEKLSRFKEATKIQIDCQRTHSGSSKVHLISYFLKYVHYCCLNAVVDLYLFTCLAPCPCLPNDNDTQGDN